jgi:hypothetical protein
MVIIDEEERMLSLEVLPVTQTQERKIWRKVHIIFRRNSIAYDECRESMSLDELENTIYQIDRYLAAKQLNYPIGAYSVKYIKSDFRFELSDSAALVLSLGQGDEVRIRLSNEDLLCIRNVLFDASDLGKDYRPPLRGQIKRVTIKSQYYYYGGPTEDDEFFAQKLTISRRGRVQIDNYNDDYTIHFDREVLSLKVAETKEILRKFFKIFFNRRYFTCMADCGQWEIVLINDKGEAFRAYGALVDDDDLCELSDDIRRILKRKRLLLFDGNIQQGIKFCSVAFQENGSEYYYITEDESIEEGDRVIVPVGPNNRECVAEVVSIKYYPKEAVPMPLDKVKTIIGIHKKEETDEE